MTAPVVFIDADVLHKAAARDILVQLGVAGIVRPRWSDTVQEEWIAALLNRRPDLTRAQLQRTRQLMDAALPDARVTGYESLIATLVPPDPNDRHVLAAAMTAGASFILTCNLSDFPIDYAADDAVPAVHPDSFLTLLCQTVPGPFLSCLATIRSRLHAHRPIQQVFWMDCGRAIFPSWPPSYRGTLVPYDPKSSYQPPGKWSLIGR